jgi:hypothetical protein
LAQASRRVLCPLIAAETGDRLSEVNRLHCRADVAYCLGDVAGAWEDARKALEMAREMGAVPREGRAHLVLGWLA